ncbi:MAG: hypothetical protein CVU90_11245 [Firmicutes bacterium HGW-Firmicutes-15]|nr:MAG: hypothetical protein CVU90_11245 [Firmicutes bacterium HGW-Firmicutes-15]
MKIRIFRHISTALFIVLALLMNSSVAYANASYYPSSWSSDKIAASVSAGITTEGFDAYPFINSITRKDFCELLINTCRVFGTTLPTPPMSHPFTDTNDINAEKAYGLGLTQGTATGIFSPDLPLTREMAAVMLSKLLMLFQSTSDNNNENIDANNVGNMQDYQGDRYYHNKSNRDALQNSYGTVSTTSAGSLTYTQPMDKQQAAKILSEYSTDSHLVSDWAKTYMADVYTHGILLGAGDGRLDPKSYLTREQAVILSLNLLTYCNDPQIRAAGAKKFILPMPTVSRGTKNERFFGDSVKTVFASINEANPIMTNINVNIWNLTASGMKTTSTLTLTVNKNVAENVIKIFADIYNGQEKFPIKSCSAYSFRSGKSEHNNGTAIDINPEENYFVEWGGAIKAGSLWKPGENPYSIPSDGDVVRAFNRYGWHWSPDMLWSNGADYMHFSLGGT